MPTRIGQEIVSIGDTVRAARHAKGITQIELAERTGVTQSAISRLESGETLDPGQELVTRIAEVLNMPLADLVGRPGPGPVVDVDRVQIPIVQVPAHAGTDWTFQATGQTIAIEQTLSRGRFLQAIKVEGDCMIPEVQPDDLVIFDKWSQDPKDGDMVVVSRDNQIHVRWARVRRTGALLELVDNFGRPFPTAGTVLEGVVVERRTIRPRRRQWHDLEDAPPASE